jgi:hypothetical protein
LADKKHEERKQAVRRIVNTHFSDPKPSVPLEDDVVMKLIFQDANITSLIQSGVISRGADLTPALLQTPALLTTQVDPNNARRSKLIADAKVYKIYNT